MRSIHASASRLTSYQSPASAAESSGRRYSSTSAATRVARHPHEAIALDADQLLPEAAPSITAHASTGSASKNSLENTTPRECLAAARRIDIDRNVAPFAERLRHLAASGAQFDHGEIRGLAHFAEQLADARRDQDAEDGLDLLRREEVAAPCRTDRAPAGSSRTRGWYSATSMKRRNGIGPPRADLGRAELAERRHGCDVPALRRAHEHLHQVVVHAVVKIALEGPGELRVLDVAGVDRERSRCAVRGSRFFSSITSSIAPLCSRAEKSSSACS